MRAGVGRRDITPPVGMPQDWSNAAHEVSIGNDLELWVTVLVVEDADGGRAALTDIDLCYLNYERVDRIRRTVAAAASVLPERVAVGVTHSHSGPATGGIAGSWVRRGRELVEPYVDSVIEALGEAAAEAASRLQPVRVGVGKGSSPLAVNRRMTKPDGGVAVGLNWDGPVDHTLTVVRLDGEDDAPVATIVHYSCHPIILGADNVYVTPEYPGIIKRVVEASLGGHCVFVQGACGDVGPREVFVGDLEVYRRLGAMIGHDAAGVAQRSSWRLHRQRLREEWEPSAWIAMFEYEPDPEPDGTLAVATEFVDMPMRGDLGDSSDWARRAAELEDELYQARTSGASEAEIRELNVRTKFAAMRAERATTYGGSDFHPLRVQGIRIGPVALLGVAAELFIETGTAIRDASPFSTTLVSGYWNGSQNYLPTDAERARGGYEIDFSPFLPGGADLVCAGAERVLDQLLLSG